MSTEQLGLFADEQAEAAAAAKAEAVAVWHRAADRALAAAILTGQPFDAHTLTEQGLPDPPRPRLMSSLFSSAHRSGRIARVGYHPSRRATCGAVVAVWQGTEAGQRQARHLLDQDQADQ